MTHGEFQQTSVDINDCFSLFVIQDDFQFPKLVPVNGKVFYFHSLSQKNTYVDAHGSV